MLIEKLEQIAEKRGFKYHIGNEHWQNLIDAADDTAQPFEEKQVHLLVFSEKHVRNYGNYAISSEPLTAVFLLAVRSKLSDPNFQYKYNKQIKPLLELARTIEKEDFLICDDLELKSFSTESWRENYLDTNMDCVEVQIRVEYNG